MYKIALEIVIFLLLVSPYAHRMLFSKVTFWNVCLPNDIRLRTFVGISLQECIKECVKRSNCGYIAYHRHAAVCQLFGKFDSVTFVHVKRSLVIRRQDFDTLMLTDECFCKEGQVCNEGTCVHEECASPMISYGGFVGNVLAVGSSLKIFCDKNGEVNSPTLITCQLSGNWSHNPICESVIGCGNLIFANGELVGTDNGVGAVRSIVCNNDYKEEKGVTEVICNSSGNWSYNPVCVSACLAGSSYSIDNFHIRVFHTKKETKDYDQATGRCVSDGGSLVKINETWKMDFVSSVLTSCSKYAHHEYWTDGKEIAGTWLFSDSTGVPMGSQYWLEGVPASGDHCAGLEGINGTFLWNDRLCTDGLKFICEY